MQVKTRKLDIFDGLELKSAVFQGQRFPAHFHDTYAVTILEKGCEWIDWQGQEIVQYAQTVSIINPFEVHSNRFFDQDEWHYKSFYINVDVLRFLLGQPVYFPRQLIEDALFAQAILRLHKEAERTLSENSLSEILPFFRQYGTGKQRSDPMPISDAMMDIAHVMQNFPDQKWSVEDLAQRCGMDKFKFIRGFKQAHGITPVSYLLVHRIQLAKKLMFSERSLTQVALDSGFYDQSHFIHCFRKHVGVAPNLYRANMGP